MTMKIGYNIPCDTAKLCTPLAEAIAYLQGILDAQPTATLTDCTPYAYTDMVFACERDETSEEWLEREIREQADAEAKALEARRIQARKDGVASVKALAKALGVKVEIKDDRS